MPDTIVRPSLKFIQAGFVLVLLLIVVSLIVHYLYLDPAGQPPWLPGLTALLLLWPISRWFRRSFTRITIKGDKLYYESGALSKQTRILQIPRIQDVRVHQSLGQRLTGVGDLSIETAGETSRMTISNIDQPRALAEKLLELVNHDFNRPHGL